MHEGVADTPRDTPIPTLTPFRRAAAAQVAASAAIGGAPVVERLLAASIGIGAVSHLEYALRLLVVPSVLFEGAIVPLSLARWSQEMANEATIPTKRDVMRIVGKGVVLALLLGLVLAVSAPGLVQVLLRHGRFTSEDSATVSSLLRVLSVAFVANMGAQILERHYIASTRNQTLALLSVARATIRVATMWLLLPTYGLVAWAIGFALSDWCYLLALVALLRAPTPGVESPRGVEAA